MRLYHYFASQGLHRVCGLGCRSYVGVKLCGFKATSVQLEEQAETELDNKQRFQFAFQNLYPIPLFQFQAKSLNFPTIPMVAQYFYPIKGDYKGPIGGGISLFRSFNFRKISNFCKKK